MKRLFDKALFVHITHVTSRIATVVRLTLAVALLSGGALAGMTALATPAAQAATFTVTTLADSGAGSLRQAIASAGVGDTITFAAGLTGTIQLASTLVIPVTGLIISGPGPNVISVSGQNNVGVFSVAPAITAVINGLTIEFGNVTGSGGGVNVGAGAALNIVNDMFLGNTATVSGGALFGGSLQVGNDTFSGNSANQGGAIFNSGTTFLINDTFFGNTAGSAGGAVYSFQCMSTGGIRAQNDTFSGNFATGNNGNAIFAQSCTANPTFLQNSIFSDGTNNCAGPASGAISPTSVGDNVENANTCNFGPFDVVNSTTINLAAALAPNGSTGPPTLAIGPNSSAFQEVTPGNCTITTDERGESRPGVAPECDAGAFEYHPPLGQCPPPSPPLNLNVTGPPYTLSWGAPLAPGCPPLTYNVFEFSQGSSASVVATTSGTSWVIPTSALAPTYSFYVEAQNAIGSSAPSNTVSISSTPSPTPPSGACSPFSGNSFYICGLYVKILGRTPDPAGLNTFLALMSAGATPTQVASDIVNSQESATDYIQSDYMAFLGRAADPGGLANFLGDFNSGWSTFQVDAAILGSQEFFMDSGGTNSGFINAVYQDLLGRPVDSAGIATWSAQLANGVSRTQVAYEIDTSLESLTDTVQFFYQTFLGRQADPMGLATWVGALQAGVSLQQVVAGIAGSPEGYNDALAGV